MRTQLHEKRRLENHLRLLCCLGLDWRLLMPDLFQALRALVPFPQGSFVLYNNQLQGFDGFSDWSFSESDAVHDLLRMRPLNHAIDFLKKAVAVYAIFGSTSCQGSNASKSSTVLARGN